MMGFIYYSSREVYVWRIASLTLCVAVVAGQTSFRAAPSDVPQGLTSVSASAGVPAVPVYAAHFDTPVPKEHLAQQLTQEGDKQQRPVLPREQSSLQASPTGSINTSLITTATTQQQWPSASTANGSVVQPLTDVPVSTVGAATFNATSPAPSSDQQPVNSSANAAVGMSPNPNPGPAGASPSPPAALPSAGPIPSPSPAPSDSTNTTGKPSGPSIGNIYETSPSPGPSVGNVYKSPPTIGNIYKTSPSPSPSAAGETKQPAGDGKVKTQSGGHDTVQGPVGPVKTFKQAKGTKEQGEVLIKTASVLRPGRNSAVNSWWSANNLCTKWWGLTCSDKKQVSEIKLQYMNLRGKLPAEWAALAPSLRLIVLTDNDLTGTIPREWRALKQLYFVRLDGNELTGPLPAEWGDLSRMTTLQLSKNWLSGSLPASWGKLSNLAELYLNDNQFTGSLPKEWSQLGSLYFLRLDSNKLSGSIPKEWGDMYSLRFVALHDNSELSGCLPHAWKGRVKFQSKGTNWGYTSDIKATGVLENTGITGWCKDDGLKHTATETEVNLDGADVAGGE